MSFERILIKREPEKSKEKVDKEDNIKNESIRELRELFYGILNDLRENIDNGVYKLIIGDDASGRIPTLIFDKIIKNIYQEKNYKKPETIFLAGSRDLKEEEIKTKQNKILKYLNKYLNQIKQGKEKSKQKILIVTDTIITGRGLKPLTDVLKKEDIKFDIAAMTGAASKEQLKQHEKYLGGKIFLGQYGGIPKIYGQYESSGVVKSHKEIFSKPLRKHNFFGSELNQEKINEIRKDIQTISQELIDWYKSDSLNVEHKYF